MYTLMKHVNQHGYGLSLVKYSEPNNRLSLESGFVLNTFEQERVRDDYALELSAMTGWEIEE